MAAAGCQAGQFAGRRCSKQRGRWWWRCVLFPGQRRRSGHRARPKVHPDGGGAYAVGKANLGSAVSLLAAASLVVDYVLTVAVSLAAGAASLASAFPPLARTCW
jgi:hypothetical protein